MKTQLINLCLGLLKFTSSLFKAFGIGLIPDLEKTFIIEGDSLTICYYSDKDAVVIFGESDSLNGYKFFFIFTSSEEDRKEWTNNQDPLVFYNSLNSEVEVANLVAKIAIELSTVKGREEANKKLEEFFN
jgi:hypothetical protein